MTLHVVRRGESLASIARHYGVTWQALAHRNMLTDPDRLRVGQSLAIPASASPHSPHHPSQHHSSPHHPSPHHAAAGTLMRPPVMPAVPGGPATAVAGDVTEAQLRAIMPNAGTARIDRYLEPLNNAMRDNNIDTNERRAAFLAQISVESGQLHHVEENLSYSAPRLRAVWPRRFPTDQVANTYAHDPEALGNYVYADRLGNGDAASGDGYRYRGRGLMQTTGRDNYRAAGFENNPDALSDPQTAANSAARFWSSHELNRRTAAVLPRSDFNGVSRTVNGGNNGSDERWTAYQRALSALQPPPPLPLR